ncbi:GNAT family N-acetyltransferase [Terribacillus sp. JSM ZJ617]|uniref:GNAT family N-acetyltransferase n=1 Tax=Terribacillus sp. JSM ZJ617 TaxID=3342119 RepID=UPI0035A9573A
MTTIRQLTINDYRAVLNMQTGIEDDYVLRIFPQLIENPAQTLFGLETEEGIAALAGVYRLPNGNGILGRLRSDIRFHSRGNATALLQHIIAFCEKDPTMNWVGAITRKSNLPAQRVLDKLHIHAESSFISLLMEAPEKFVSPSAAPWELIEGTENKRAAIEQAAVDTKAAFYPFEAYFPIPYASAILEDAYIEKLAVFRDPDSSRVMAIQEDHKGMDIAQIQYLWPDVFQQDGLWAAVFNYLKQSDKPLVPQLDVSSENASSIPAAFSGSFTEDDDPWLIYGRYIR